MVVGEAAFTQADSELERGYERETGDIWKGPYTRFPTPTISDDA